MRTSRSSGEICHLSGQTGTSSHSFKAQAVRPLAAEPRYGATGTAAKADIDRLAELGATPSPTAPGWAERVRAVAPRGVGAVFDTTGAGLLDDLDAHRYHGKIVLLP